MTRLLPLALALVGVGLQISYPLTSGDARDGVTIAVVLVLAATSVLHAALTRGARLALTLVLAVAVPAFAIEVLGVHTGVPFGSYSYGTGLGTRLFGVPLVVAAAWVMLAWPAALVARRLVDGHAARVVVGAWALAGCDVFLDPQMVAAGQWNWADPAPHLPGVPTVPLTNFAGWLLVSLFISAMLQIVLAHAPESAFDDVVPIALYVWLWIGWIVALGGFLDLGAAAAWGAAAMGTVALPAVRRLAPHA